MAPAFRFQVSAVLLMALSVCAGCATSTDDSATSEGAIRGSPGDALFEELARADISEFRLMRFEAEETRGSAGGSTLFNWEHGGTKNVFETVFTEPSPVSNGASWRPVRVVVSIDGISKTVVESHDQWSAWVGGSIRERYRRDLLARYEAAPLEAFGVDDSKTSKDKCNTAVFSKHMMIGTRLSGAFAWSGWSGAESAQLVCDFNGDVLILHPSGVAVPLLKTSDGDLIFASWY